MIFISTGSLAAIILLLTYILSSYYERLACNEIYRYASGSINQATSTVQFLSESVNNLLLQCSQNPEINRLFIAESYDSSEIYNAKRELDSIRYNNSKIYSVYVYDQYSDSIFESCEFSQGFNSPRETFYDTQFLDCLENLDEIRVFTPVVRTIPVIRDNVPETSMKVLTYFYFEPYFGPAEEKHSIIAFNVSISWLQQALGHFHGASPDVNDIEIITRDGQVVFSGKEALIGTEYEDTEILDRILEDDADYGWFVEEGVEQRLITYSKSSYTGYEDWIFLSENDLGTVMQPIRDMRSFVYLVTGLILIFSILGMTVVLRRFSAPIKQAFSKADLLEREQEEKRKREAAEYMKRILEGDVEEDTAQIRENFERLKINYDFEAENFLVLISLDDRSSIHRRLRGDYPDMLRWTEELVETAFFRQFKKAFRVDWQDGVSIVIVCLSEESVEERIRKMQEVFEEISGGLNERVSGSASFSVSSVGETIKDMPFLLSETLEIHTYRYLYGYGKMLNASVLQNRTEGNYVYPKEVEREIINALFLGKLEEACSAYQTYVKTLSEMSVSEIKISFLLLADAVKYASRNTVAETSNVLMNFEHFFAKIQMLENIEEVNRLFLHLFQEITEMIEEQKEARYAELIDFVKDYVKENYGRVDLSMQEIAEKVDMSAAYLGRIFKQHTDIAFTEYLTRFRLQVACDDLLHSDRTVSEISDRVGFTNSSYFYQVFKKYMNCTPTQYRKNRPEA